MQTVAFASQKGGAGKSTLAAHLSVLADADASPALLIDIDPQRSLSFWHSLRSADTPALIEAGARDIPDILKDAKADGVKWVFIDGPPHDGTAMAEMMRAADLVIIPTRPSAFDLAAVNASINMAVTLKRRHLAVLNSTPPKRGVTDTGIVSEARSVLKGMGATVWDSSITQRAALAHAIAGGMSVGELEPASAADREMQRLWRDVRRTLEKSK